MVKELTRLWYRFRWHFLTTETKKQMILSMARHPAYAVALKKAMVEQQLKHGKDLD